jgi:hypothetical protein
MHSTDYGATWSAPEIAVDTGGLNHPWGIVADGVAAHAMTGPDDSMQYAFRTLCP